MPFNGSAADLAVLALVVGGRLLLPLLIPWFPLPGIVMCLVLDAVDQSLFQGLTRLQLDFYQGYDKALDVYYLSIAYLSTFRNWDNRFAFRVTRALFYLRLAGVALFEWLDWRVILFLLPNTFEYFFIWYELVRRRTPRRLSRTTVISAAAAIWILIKLPQEYWIHIARLDLTDVLKTALFGASPETPWGHIFRAAPWLYVAVALLAVGVLLALVRLATRRLPPADDRRGTTDDGQQADGNGRPWAVGRRGPFTPDRAQLRAARAASAARIVDRDLAEKLGLVALITAIFAQIIPTVRPTTPQVVFGATAVVLLTTALSHVVARRGVTWTNTLGQFLAVLLANFALVFFFQALPGARDLHEGEVLFFILLLSVVVTLFDRFQIVQRARWGEERGQVPGSRG